MDSKYERLPPLSIRFRPGYLCVGYSWLCCGVVGMGVNPDALEIVADCTACAVLDLRANLKSTHNAYMDGEISRGAYEYVLKRYDQLLWSLKEAGYTDQHPIFDFPIKPADPS